MELFGGIKNFATQIGNVGQKAQEFGSRSLASHGLSDALVMKYAQGNEKGLLDRASFSAFGGGGGGSWRGSASLANFPKYRARQISEFGINILKDAPSTLVNLAEAGTSKVAQGLSQTTFGKYAQGNKDGLIDQALLGLAFGPAALALGPKQSEQIFASVGEKVADPMSRLYHNDVFQAVGSALNQGSGLFSTLSILPDPVGAMFGAANIATEALYGVFLSTGTFDGSVSTSDALAPAKQASEGLAQIELSKYSEKFSGKLNKISGKDKGHKEIGVSQSLKQLRSGGIKKFIGGGTYNILKNYLGRLTGLGIHYARIAKRHNVVKGILDFLTLSHEVYDKYDKLSKTKIGHSFINSSFEHGKSAGQWLDYKAHNASHFLLNHRAQIGDTLHKASSILGGASVGLGIVAAGLVLTGIGAPVAAVLGTVSLSLAAASAAAQAWYAVTKSVGTIDGSVSTGEANHAAAQAATNLALTLVSVEVASAQAVAKAKTMLETKNALSFLHSNPRAVLQLDKATKFLNKLPGVNLGLIFRDAVLVKRLKIGSLALKVAQIPATIASMGGLHGILHTWHTVENKALGLGHRGKALALTALHAGRQAFQKIGHGGLHLLQSAGRGLTNAGHTVLGKITDLRSQAAHLAARAQMWARQGVHRGEAALLTGLAAALQGSHALTATANGFLQRSGGQMLHGIAHAFTESLSHNLSTAQTVLGFLEGGGHPEQIGSALYEITQNLHGVTHGVGGLFSTVFGEKQHSAGPVHLPLRPVMPSFAGSPLSSMGHLPALAFAGMPGHHTGAAPFSPLFPLFNSHSSSHSPLGGSLSGFIGRTASAVSGTAHHMPSLLPSLMPGHGILPKRTAGFARPAVHMAQSLSSTGSHGHSSTAAPVLSAIHHFLPSLKLPVPSAILPAFAVHPFAGLQTAEHHVKQMGHQALSHMPGIPGALGHMMHGFGRFLQRKGSGDHPDVHPAALRDDLRKQSSGFVPDSNVRAKLGGHLGFDPGGARLHTGPAAASASRALNAEAFTIGSDVFFGDGRFDPHTPKGLGLIAHELTHVGQQTGTTGNKARFFTAQGGDEMEREAQQTGERVLANAGSQSGLFVEDYVREYEGEKGLSQADQQRLDHISVMALDEAKRMLERQGRRNLNVDALDVQIEIDLSEMSDSEVTRVWATAILTQVNLHTASPINFRHSLQRSEDKDGKLITDPSQDPFSPLSTLEFGHTRPTVSPYQEITSPDPVRTGNLEVPIYPPIDAHNSIPTASVSVLSEGEKRKQALLDEKKALHDLNEDYEEKKAAYEELKEEFRTERWDEELILKKYAYEAAKAKVETAIDQARAKLYGTGWEGEKNLLFHHPSMAIDFALYDVKHWLEHRNDPKPLPKQPTSIWDIIKKRIPSIPDPLSPDSQDADLNRSALAGTPADQGPTEQSALKTQRSVSLTSNDIEQLSATQKIEEVIGRSVKHHMLSAALAEKVASLLTPQTLAMIAGSAAIFAALQATPLGWLADIGALGVAAYAFGSEAITLTEDISGFVSGALQAHTEDDLDRAAECFAGAVSIIGVDGLIALLLHKTSKASKVKIEAKVQPEEAFGSREGIAENPDAAIENEPKKYGRVAKPGDREYSFNSVENPGPLAILKDRPAANFRSGQYDVITLDQDTVFHRIGQKGGGRNALGQWFTRKPSVSAAQGTDQLAIKRQWIDPKTGKLTGQSSLESSYSVLIPRGTKIYEGPAGSQGAGFSGGRIQQFIPEPWNIRGVMVLDEEPLP